MILLRSFSLSTRPAPSACITGTHAPHSQDTWADVQPLVCRKPTLLADDAAVQAFDQPPSKNSVAIIKSNGSIFLNVTRVKLSACRKRHSVWLWWLAGCGCLLYNTQSFETRVQILPQSSLLRCPNYNGISRTFKHS